MTGRLTGRFTRVRVLVAVVLAACALSSCGGPRVVDHDGVSVVISGRSGGMDAMLSGKLSVVEGGCLGIDAEGTEYLVAWPAETELGDHDGVSVRIGPDTYALGDDVEVAGGAVEIANAHQLPDIPSSCPFEEIFVANNN